MIGNQANYFKIGVFVIVCVALIVGSILVLGAGALFREVVTLETYFDESVEGLTVGSKVRYRGVEIGKVAEISFVREVYGEDRPHYVRVVFTADVATFRGLPVSEVLGRAEGEGLRVRLKKELVSGSASIEADYGSVQAEKLKIDWVPQYLYIESTPSLAARIEQAGQEFLARINEIDVEGLVARVEQAFSVVTTAVSDSDVPSLVRDVRSTLGELGPMLRAVRDLLDEGATKKILSDASSILASARELVDETKSEVPSAVSDLRNTLRDLDSLVHRVDRSISDQSRSLGEVLDNLRIVTQHLETLFAGVEQYPSRILLGDPPNPIPRREKP